MHDPQVTYRSIFGIDQDPPQWKSAFEEANAGCLPLTKPLNVPGKTRNPAFAACHAEVALAGLLLAWAD